MCDKADDMNELPRIANIDDLKIWLRDRDPDEATKIAHRAAMRVVPCSCAGMTEDWLLRHNPRPTNAFQLLLYSLRTSVAFNSASRLDRPPKYVSGNAGGSDAAHIDQPARFAGLVRQIADAAFAWNKQIQMAEGMRRHAGEQTDEEERREWEQRVRMAEATAKHPFEDALRHAVEVVGSAASLASFCANKWPGDEFVAADQAFWSSVALDVHRLSRNQDIGSSPLWSGENPLAGAWNTGLPVIRDYPGGYFWIDWYQRALDGRPQNWSLLRDIALIDDALWRQGGEVLENTIEELRRQHGLELTANAERIEPNPDTGLLRLVPDSRLPEGIAAYARRKIIKATEVFDDYTGQAYGALAPDLAMLRRAVADAGNLPLELLDACAAATRRLAIRIDNGDCPFATQDPLIADYQSRLREAGADILASDPEAQKVLARRATLDGDQSLIEAKQAIEKTVATVAPLLEGRLADTLPLDAQTASDPDTSPDERAAASFRLAGRILRIERALPFAVDVCKGFGVGNAGLVGVATYLQAIEFFARSPVAKSAIAAVFRYMGL